MTRRTYRALLIANSTFPEDAFNLQDLEGPRNDPVVLRDALCDGEVGLFPADNVRVVPERTMAEVLREVEDFLRSATQADTLLLYYSGHGMLDQSNELFLCTHDSRVERLRSTAVKATDLRAMMDESAAAALVVVLDCCHSGRFKGGEMPSALSGRGRFVLTSSRPAELAHDAHTRNHASLFTHHLAEGLRHGAPDLDGDGLVNLSELYDYVHAVLRREGRPEPQKRFAGSGDVAVALRPARPDQRPEQPELVDPALAVPVLDLPETALDLGEIAADEVLPPERIAVINRGGGTLDWTVESSAPWLRAEAEEGAAVLHLQPSPGANRANVYVTDTRTGTIKTVRVTVRVRAADTTAPPVVLPEVEPPEVEPPLPPPKPRARPKIEVPKLPRLSKRPSAVPAASTATLPVWPAVASIAAGTAVWVAADLGDADDLLVRGQGYGAGFGLSLLVGIVLLLVGLLALRPRWRATLTTVCLGLLVPLMLLRLGEIEAYEQLENTFLLWCSVALCIVAVVLVLRSLLLSDLWGAQSWAPEPLVVWTMLTAGLWIAALFVDPYYQQDGFGGSSYGGLFDSSPTGRGAAGACRLGAVVAVAVCAYWGLRRLPPAQGRGLVLGATLVPLLAVVHEAMYVVFGEEDPDSSRLLVIAVVPAVAVALCGATAFWWSRRELADIEEQAPAGRPVIGSLGRTLRASARWIRRRPLAAAGRASVAVAATAGAFVLLGLGPPDESIFTLSETGEMLTVGAFSPDGDLLAVPSFGGVQLWDPSTFQLDRTLGSDEWVDLAAFSPDGDVIATAGDDGVKLWNAGTGNLESRLADDPDDDGVSALVFSPDSELLVVVYGYRIDVYVVVDPDSVDDPSTYEDPDGSGYAVAFSPDGKRLAVSGMAEDGEIEIWDGTTFDVERTLTDSTYSWAQTMSFSADGELLAADEEYSSVGLWDPSTSSGAADVGIDIDDYVEALAFSPVGDLLAVGVEDAIELWDVSTGERLETLTGHDDDIDSLAFSPDGRFIASSGYDSIRLWRTPDV